MLVLALLALVYRGELFTDEQFDGETKPARYHGPLVVKTILVVAVMIALFFLGQPVAKVAIVGGVFLLFTRRVNPGKIYREVDWPLLVMFAGFSSSLPALKRSCLHRKWPQALVVCTWTVHWRSLQLRLFCQTRSATCRQCSCSSHLCQT